MVTRLCLCITLTFSCMYADWITDLSHLVKDGDIDILRASQVVQRYVDRDKKNIDRLEKKLEANDEDGLLATLWAGNYQIRWGAAQTQYLYHKKVLIFIKSLSQDKDKRLKFTKHLAQVRDYEEELQELKDSFDSSASWGQCFRSGGSIAAKELQLTGYRAFIKSSFIV